jgi:hypothetical protein
MFGSSGSTRSSYIMFDPHSGDQPKVAHHVYCRQQHAVEIIQLIEVPAPSQRFAPSRIGSSSSSSSYSCSTASEYSSHNDVVSSYCSSDTPEETTFEEDEPSTPDTTYDTRVTRIHAWRDKFARDMGFTLPGMFFHPFFFLSHLTNYLVFRYTTTNEHHQTKSTR